MSRLSPAEGPLKYLFAVLLLLLPTVASAHERIIYGIVVPNAYGPAWENGRVNRDTGDLNGPSYVEAGRFHSIAEAQAAGVSVSGAGVQVVQVQGMNQYRLWIGPYANRDAAQAGLNAAHAAGLGHGRVR